MPLNKETKPNKLQWKPPVTMKWGGGVENLRHNNKADKMIGKDFKVWLN